MSAVSYAELRGVDRFMQVQLAWLISLFSSHRLRFHHLLSPFGDRTDCTMTHNEQRGHWLKEGALGLTTGVLYGISSVAVGHPSVTERLQMLWHPQ